jgi:hypothetical protein
VAFQNHGADFVKRSLNRLNLPDDVNAIGIVFYHALDAADVTFDILQSLMRFLILHKSPLSFTPPHGGRDHKYMILLSWKVVKCFQHCEYGKMEGGFHVVKAGRMEDWTVVSA